MRKGLLFVFILLNSQFVFAQTEIGPEGNKLLWIFLFLAFATVVILRVGFFGKKNKKHTTPFFSKQKVSLDLKKDARYYPDKLTLTVTNKGITDIDLEQPLLIFDNFWMKRKFRLKGMDKRSFYPLYLEKGKTHTLEIDLAQFYKHDKSLKKFSKTKIVLFNVKGKKLGRTSIFLRKTLFKF